MSRKTENTDFICFHCGKQVPPLTNGSYRNHCPFCLYSLHVDTSMGDRESSCLGLMEPQQALFNSKKGHQIIHKCLRCGVQRVNKIAENTDTPDCLDVILTLLTRR